jgi:hypothetical protein
MITKALILKTPCLRLAPSVSGGQSLWRRHAGKQEEMPEKFTIDQFIDHLSLVQKIERGIQQSEHDKVIMHEQAIQEIDSWFN